MRGRAVASFLLALATSAAVAQEIDPRDLDRRTLERRAVEAAIWGMPLVSVETMRQAFFRAGAKYGDILYFTRPADWRFQTTTPNGSSLYVYLNFNLKDGPVVLDFPAAVGAGLFGSLSDAWQVPLVEVGPEGDDRGKGGKYLLIPPDFKGSLPKDHFPVRSATYNGYGLFRAIPATSSEEDVAKAIALSKKVRLYPLAHAADPPAMHAIDITGKLFEGIPRYDDSFYDSLARMVGEEPVQIRDFVAMAQVHSLGIEKGKEFKPGRETRASLRKAIAEAHAGFMRRAAAGDPWWPKSKWIVSASLGPKTAFTYILPDHLEIDERAMTFFLAYAPPKRLGRATFYLASFKDSSAESFRGERTYRLRVPANVPAKQFWAVTVYDLASAGFIRESPRVSLDSYDHKAQRNGDGSLDVYFGPKAPPGKEANWIYTAPGKPWFTFFRFYGPGNALFEKSWKLGDIEEMK